MSNRHKGAKRRAENMWKFDTLETSLRLDRVLNKASKVTNTTNSQRLQRARQALFTQHYPDSDIDGQHLLDVTGAKSAEKLDSEHQLAREDIMHLRAHVKSRRQNSQATNNGGNVTVPVRPGQQETHI